MFSHPRLILSMFSHPMLRKCCQGSNFPQIPKILASIGSAGSIVAQTLGNFGSHFKLQEFWGNLLPVDVFASDVAKMLPGSNFPKVSEAGNAKTLAGIKFPQNS